jgi:hypothetical protein
METNVIRHLENAKDDLEHASQAVANFDEKIWTKIQRLTIELYQIQYELITRANKG